ncbi:solute carrier family 15 member 1b [Chaetodon auriga]|uniref:solute carrier family 15 member 1b n=1 Tax=Chaetodon auriga TaxID=39042 RepID=UPI0040330E73
MTLVSADPDKRERKSKSMMIFGYPVSIFFIVVNEFCERFSYYGMRAVLVLYFTSFLKWGDDFATTIYHAFVALCYLTPILGAIVADSWLGKYRTIVYLSIVYTVGQGVLAVSSVNDITDSNRDGTPDNMDFHIALSMVGLILIALGTGGIKPCVAAFGGDQFEEHQEKQRSTFFSIFYLSINAGSLLSTLITPILKALECGIHSKQLCYPLAFGVPAILMLVALIVFIIGNSMYYKAAPQGNIIVKVCQCTWFALMNRFRHRSPAYPKRDHWMDWAEERYDKLLIAQVKMVLKVLFLYIPLPMFWALFDQQGSRWTLQATTMDGDFGAFIIQPEQMQIVNPVLILILVPIVDNLVYPLIAKCRLNFSPLKRMTVGMFLASLAFVAAALVQIEIDKTLPQFPSSTEGQAKFINMLNDVVDVKAGNNSLTLHPYGAHNQYVTFDDSFTLTLQSNVSYDATIVDGGRSTFVIFPDETIPMIKTFTDITSKPALGANAIRFLNGYNSTLNVTVDDLSFDYFGPRNMSEYVLVPQGNAHFIIKDDFGGECYYDQKFDFGSSYTLIIMPNLTLVDNCALSIRPVMDMSRNSVNIAWLIPQYFLITAGEVVFSVTGLEFSYSQAPSNMKAVLQAGWLLTVAVGNIIVLIVAEAAKLPKQWAEYVLFACLLVVVCVIFSIMAYFYTYIDPAKIEAQFIEVEPEDKGRKKSLEMVRRDSDSSSDEEETKQTKI